MNKNIVLIYPPMEFGYKRGFGYPPLGILYIASYLQKKGINVKVIDGFIESLKFKELINKILTDKPFIVGFSAMTCQINSVIKISKKLKKINPSLIIAVGGSHISSTKQELFNFTKDIDYLFYGECEREFYKFIKNYPNIRDIKGLIYKNNGKIIINDMPDSIKDLDNLPNPNYDFIKIKKYDGYFAKSLPIASLMASRGCSFRCGFCDAYATHGRCLRLRSPKNIVDEMEEKNKKYNIKQFMFQDSTFTLNKKWVYEICKKLNERKLKFKWSCNTRVDMVDEDLLKTMKKSGCYIVLFGIESGSQRILDFIHKGTTISKIKNAIKLCKKVGLKTAGYFIFGFPTETEEDAQKTLDLIKELNLDLIDAGTLSAYKGTEVFEWGLKNNCLDDEFWYMKDLDKSKSVRELHGGLELKDFPVKKQKEYSKKAIKQFYFRFNYLLKRILSMRHFHDIKRNLKAFQELSIVKKHEKTFLKSIVLAIFITILYYGIGIILVDIMNLHYYSAGLIPIPLIFFIRYAINKYWVFKDE